MCGQNLSHLLLALSLATLGFEGLGSTTWGALVLMIVHRPTLGSNVISPMSSTTIFEGLMNGSICMSKVFISVYCANNFGKMIQLNGVFTLIGGSTSMEPIDCMDVS